MNAPDPRKLADMIEKYFPTMGPLLNRIVVLFLVLLVVGLGGTVFFGQFIGGLVWPFLTNLFGSTDTGISLDNIEAIIIVLVLAVVFFVVIFAVFVLFSVRIFRKRVLPQSTIDQVADLRSEGVSLYSDRMDETAVDDWWAKQTAWSNKVATFLDDNLTKAEALSFRRLGMIPDMLFAQAISEKHRRLLGILAKKLDVLENLIDRHQERL